MGYVTKDQLERARQYDVLDYVLRYEADTVKRVGKSYRRKDDDSVEIDTWKWRCHKEGLRGRTALDYLTDVKGYALVDAVCFLIGEQPQERSRSQGLLVRP